MRPVLSTENACSWPAISSARQEPAVLNGRCISPAAILRGGKARFSTRPCGWAPGVTAEGTRDNPQRILIGPPQQPAAWGTGMIPADAILIMGRGAPHGLDSVVVRHGGGGDVQADESVLSFKSYEKGREKWQGETLRGVWFDEEPPLDIYSEGLTRTNATGGITIVTFTPLLGMSDVVLLFLSAEEVEGMGR
ncbi:hypothetical protein MES5069_1270023 [Mesorhizobium escarrei]|uniref:DUF2793 domain-containing protein n=1 Tax=Mesorhizobium escarrei TaxID=666018 RepID=A0ABM9DH68_9HYPH|nr:hypothetical protein MES5069_1270023 [Mesorhizobium escarrei]